MSTAVHQLAPKCPGQKYFKKRKIISSSINPNVTLYPTLLFHFLPLLMYKVYCDMSSGS